MPEEIYEFKELKDTLRQESAEMTVKCCSVVVVKDVDKAGWGETKNYNWNVKKKKKSQKTL